MKHKNPTNCLSRAVTASVLCMGTAGISPVLLAQDTTEVKSRQIEEVMVTATKRATKDVLQQVPIAATVVSEQMISENNFVDIIEVAAMVPSASFRETGTYPGTQRFWMRGTGTSFSTPNFDPAVAVYQDGVFVAQNIAAILDTFDMESIEILRGPQGTLFGRNATSGVVSTRSLRPGDELDIRAEVTYGSHDRQDYSVSVGGPLVEGSLSGKLAYMSREKDGWAENVYDGSDFGAVEQKHIRGTLVWTPTDSLSIDLIVENFRRDGDGSTSFPLGTCDSGKDCHGLGWPARDWDELYVDNVGIKSHLDQDIDKYILEANWDLGHGTITSITGFIDVEAYGGGRFDGISTYVTAARQHIEQDQFSQELRYASEFSEKLDFTAGLYYFEQDLNYGEIRGSGSRVGVPQPGVPDQSNPNGLRPPGVGLLDHEAWGIFIEGHYNFTDKLSMTLGARHTGETKKSKLGFVNYGSCTGGSTPPVEKSTGWACHLGADNGYDSIDDEDWTNVQPKVGLEYRPTDDVMLYTSLQRGYRSGGFSMRANASELSDPTIRPAFYDRERVDQLEIGLKSDWWDKRLRTNFTVYHQEWDGIQRSIREGMVQRTSNVDDSEISGVEVEVNAIVGLDMLMSGDMLRVDFSWSHWWSKYNSPYIVSVDGEDIDISDQDFVAPDETAFVGVSYEHPLGSGGSTLSWRVTYEYQSAWWTEGPHYDTGLGYYPSREIWNANVQWDSPNQTWYVKAFGKNLNDEQYYNTVVPFTDSYGIGLAAPGSTWGVTLGYRM